MNFPSQSEQPKTSQRTQQQLAPSLLHTKSPQSDKLVSSQPLWQDLSLETQFSLSTSRMLPPLDNPLLEPDEFFRSNSRSAAAQALTSSVMARATAPSAPNSASPDRFAARPTRSVSRERTFSLGMLFFLVAMIALVIGSSAILVALYNNKEVASTSQSKSDTTTTQSTLNTTTPTDTTKAATSTATDPTKSPANPGQDTNNPYLPGSGVIVMNDALTSNNAQVAWQESPGTCAFTGGSYHAMADSQDFTVCYATKTDYSNFAYQVQMNFIKTGANTSSGGLIFRTNTEGNAFYFFEINKSGHYYLYRCPGDGAQPSCPLLAGGKNANPITNFNTADNVANTLAVVANGPSLSIYVNQQLVGNTINDPTYTHGMIGMIARKGSDNGTDVSFSNIKIWKLP